MEDVLRFRAKELRCLENFLRCESKELRCVIDELPFGLFETVQKTV